MVELPFGGEVQGQPVPPLPKPAAYVIPNHVWVGMEVRQVEGDVNTVLDCHCGVSTVFNGRLTSPNISAVRCPMNPEALDLTNRYEPQPEVVDQFPTPTPHSPFIFTHTLKAGDTLHVSSPSITLTTN